MSVDHSDDCPDCGRNVFKTDDVCWNCGCDLAFRRSISLEL